MVQSGLEAQTSLTTRKIEGLSLFGNTDQGFALGPDSTVYFYDGKFFDSKIFRYDELGDSLVQIPCDKCSQIEDLAVAEDGTLYIADGLTGIIRLDGGGDTVLLSMSVQFIAVGEAGHIYAVHDAAFLDGSILVFDGAVWSEFNSDNSALQTNTFYGVSAAPDTSAWISTREGLAHYRDSTFTMIPGYDFRVDETLVGPSGKVWLLPQSTGYRIWTGSQWEIYEQRFPFSARGFSAMGLSSDTSLWCTRDALYRDDRLADTAEIIPYSALGFEGGTPFVRQMQIDAQDRIWLSGDFDFLLIIEPGMTVSTPDQPPVQPLSIYPNPTTDYLTIALPSTVLQSAPDLTLQLTDVAGRVVLSKKLTNAVSEYQLLVAHLPSGRYYCTLLQGARRWLGQVQLR